MLPLYVRVYFTYFWPRPCHDSGHLLTRRKEFSVRCRVYGISDTYFGSGAILFHLYSTLIYSLIVL